MFIYIYVRCVNNEKQSNSITQKRMPPVLLYYWLMISDIMFVVRKKLNLPINNSSFFTLVSGMKIDVKQKCIIELLPTEKFSLIDTH